MVPVNTSFETDITLYNPYPVQLNVTELYGSGSGFHLEPVDDEKSWVRYNMHCVLMFHWDLLCDGILIVKVFRFSAPVHFCLLCFLVFEL